MMAHEEAYRVRQREILSILTSGNKYVAIPCNCGDRECETWHIFPCADAPGVGFTKKEAHIAAQALNEAKELESK